MKYNSTRNKENFYSLQDVALRPLAPCGGLYMPVTVPHVDMDVIERLSQQSFADMATYISTLFFGDEVSGDKLFAICHDAFNFPVPLIRMGNTQMYTLELFHGPTMAFKDFGARFMARMINELRGNRKITILTATSGDTGSAVASGFEDIDGVKVVVLYPKSGVTDFQERQMTMPRSNVTALKVDGTFDDCQKMVKDVFADTALCDKYNITSANSISILRWLPQTFYYFYAYQLWKKASGSDSPTVIVPSGNFGNMTAAVLATRMGLPLGKIVAACNQNDTMVKYMKTGNYMPQQSVKTIANAMDIGNPSNFERLEAMFSNIEIMRKHISIQSFTDAQIKNNIVELREKYRYLSCPHGATAYGAAVENGMKGFWVSTAHPAKFKEVLCGLSGIEPQFPQSAERYINSEKKFTSIAADIKELKCVLRSI
ncbi:MAG: threonine synthase [Rikenellaceae bacterium]